MNLLHEITLWVCIVIVLITLWLLSPLLGILTTIAFTVWYIARHVEHYSSVEPEAHTNQQVWEKYNATNNIEDIDL